MIAFAIIMNDVNVSGARSLAGPHGRGARALPGQHAGARARPPAGTAPA